MILSDEPPSAAKLARLESSSTLPVARGVLEGDNAPGDTPPAYAQAASSEASPLLPRHELTHSSKRRFRLGTLIGAVFLLLPALALIVLLGRKAPHTPESRNPEGLGYCMDFNNMTFKSETGVYRSTNVFVTASQASIITFQSLSPLAMGDFTVLPLPDQAKGIITIAATAIHKDKAAIYSTHLCTVRSPGGESRSTIYVSDNGLNWDNKIMLYVTLLLPLDTIDDHSRVYFPELRTNMAYFQQTMDFEERPVYLEKLALHSVNSSIEVSGVVVQDADMSTIDADISAHLFVTNSASFKASNGTIRVNADIINTVPGGSSVVTMAAERGSIVSKLNLKYPKDRGGDGGGGFNISASSSHLPLVLAINEQPPESVLHLNATSEQSQTNIYLPPAFEGELSAFSRSPIHLFEERVSDPRGEDREREVEWEVTKLDKLRQAQGRVYWKPSHVNGTGGDVFVRALDAPITIYV